MSKIIVYKDGSYKFVDVSFEYENDPDYLVTIPVKNDYGVIIDMLSKRKDEQHNLAVRSAFESVVEDIKEIEP